MQMQRIATQIIVICIPVALLCLFSIGFWRLWKKVCAKPKPGRDLPVLSLIPFLSPLMFGITWWHIPEQGGNWNISYIVFPLLVSVAMFSYSLYSIVSRRYLLLSTLAILTSGLAALLECVFATVIILVGFVSN